MVRCRIGREQHRASTHLGRFAGFSPALQNRRCDVRTHCSHRSERPSNNLRWHSRRGQTSVFGILRLGRMPAMRWRVQERRLATRRAFRKNPPNSTPYREMSVFIFGLIGAIGMYFSALIAREKLRTRSLSGKMKLLYRFTWGLLCPKEDFDFRALAEL